MELQANHNRLCLAGAAPSITFEHGSETEISDVDGIFNSSRRFIGSIIRFVSHSGRTTTTNMLIRVTETESPLYDLRARDESVDAKSALIFHEFFKCEEERECLQTVELELDLLLHGIQKLSFRSRVIMEYKRFEVSGAEVWHRLYL